MEVFCHVVGEVRLNVTRGEEQSRADTFVATVRRAAADKRARFPAFPCVPDSCVWHVLQVLEVSSVFFFITEAKPNK